MKLIQMNIRTKIMLHTLTKTISLFCLFSIAGLLLTGCGEKSGGTEQEDYRMKPVFDRKKVDAGFVVYIANCQKCHGNNGIGAKDWRTPGVDGKYPPPPLNGTGHTWHHPRAVLKQLISEGTEPEGNMPGWSGKLTDQEIDNIITWFQSIWQPQVYHAWSDIDKRK